MRIRRLTAALEAEFEALVELHASTSIKEFWRSACRLLHLTLPGVTIWFAPETEGALGKSIFSEETIRSRQQAQRSTRRHSLQVLLGGRRTTALAGLKDVGSAAESLKFDDRFLAGQTERFSLALAFRDGTSVRGLLGLIRSRKDGPFSRPELQTVEWLHGELAAALRAVWKVEGERSLRVMFERVLTDLPLPILILDPHFNVLYQNEAARECLALWDGADDDGEQNRRRRFEIPASLRTLCRQLQERRKRPRDDSEYSLVVRSTVPHSGVPELRASVQLLNSRAQSNTSPFFVVSFRQANFSHGVTEFGSSSQLLALTRSEREVASLVCRGESNKEVAIHLGKSVLTVKAQLQSVYAKLGVAGRARLIALHHGVAPRLSRSSPAANKAEPCRS